MKLAIALFSTGAITSLISLEKIFAHSEIYAALNASICSSGGGSISISHPALHCGACFALLAGAALMVLAMSRFAKTHRRELWGTAP